MTILEMLKGHKEFPSCDPEYSPICSARDLQWITLLSSVEVDECQHNGYTVKNVCNFCGKHLSKKESDRCCNG